jgi:hypothetical protein
MAKQVVDWLAYIRVDLEEGVFSSTPSTNPNNPTVITYNNIDYTKDLPPNGLS